MSLKFMEGFFMAYDQSGSAREHHFLHMEGREQLTVAGVEDVDRFDETGIVMTTSAGTLIITGSNLHIGQLNLDGGELHVDGQIDALQYEDDRREGGGFFSRLFG